MSGIPIVPPYREELFVLPAVDDAWRADGLSTWIGKVAEFRDRTEWLRAFHPSLFDGEPLVAADLAIARGHNLESMGYAEWRSDRDNANWEATNE